jgi:hypothetical protein
LGSASSTEYIGCVVTAYNFSGGVQVSCTAATASGTTFSCIATGSGAEDFMAAANGINDDSHIVIQKNAGFSDCNVIQVYHYSTHYKK